MFPSKGILSLVLLQLGQHVEGQHNPHWEAEKHMLQSHHVHQQRKWEEAAMRAAKDANNPYLPPSTQDDFLGGSSTYTASASSSTGASSSSSRTKPRLPPAFDVGAGAAASQEAQQGSTSTTTSFVPLQMPPDALSNLHLKFNSSKPAHILLAAPSYGGMVTEGFAMSLVKASGIVQTMPGLEMSIKLLPGDSLITRARNTLVALFLGSPQYTHLLFVDTDITFTMDNILRLLTRMEKTPITAAPYPKKGLIFSRLVTFIQDTLAQDPQHEFTEEELQDSMIDFVFNPVSENQAGKKRGLKMEDGFVQVDNAGAGFLMIRRDVLVTMAEFYSDLQYKNDLPSYSSPVTDDHFYGLFDTMIDPSSRRLLSEDYAFCRRAQALGYEIWMDLYSDLKHHGSFSYDGNFLGTFRLEVQEQQPPISSSATA